MADTDVTISEDVTSISIPSDTEITITEDVTEVKVTATTPGIIILSFGTFKLDAFSVFFRCKWESAIWA